MKKLLTILLILFAVNTAYSQNTTTLPTPTASFAPSFRYYGTLLDSLRQTWMQTPGGGWNRMVTMTEANLRFAASTALTNSKLDSVLNKPNLRKQFNVKTYGAVGSGTTDDRSAVQSAINAASANGGGIVYFPKGIYLIHGALVNSGGTGIGSPNSQLYIPYSDYVNGFNSISLVGESPPALLASVLGASPINRGGVIIYSDITGSGTSPAILGTIGAAATSNYNYVSVAISNIEFRVKANIAASGPTMSAVNMYNVGGNVNIEHSAVGLDTSTFYSVSPVAETAGFILPRVGGGQSSINDVGVTGLKYGFVISEHVTGDLITAVGCERAIVGLYGDHPNYLNRVNSAWCKYPLTSHSGTTYANGGGGVNTTRIAQLDNEFQTGYGSWFDQAYTVYDPDNELRGGMEYQMVRRNVGGDTVSFTANGATKFTSIRIGNRDIRNLAKNNPAYTGLLTGVNGTNADTFSWQALSTTDTNADELLLQHTPTGLNIQSNRKNVGARPLTINGGGGQVVLGGPASGSTSTVDIPGTVTVTGTITAPIGVTDPTTGTGVGTSIAFNNSTTNAFGIGTGALRASAYDIWFQTGASNGGGYRFYQGTNEIVTFSKTGTISANVPAYSSGTNLPVVYNSTNNRFETNVALVGAHGNATSTGAGTTTFRVTLSTTRANSAYYVSITPRNALTSVNYYISDQQTTYFDVTFISALTGSVSFDWNLTP